MVKNDQKAEKQKADERGDHSSVPLDMRLGECCLLYPTNRREPDKDDKLIAVESHFRWPCFLKLVETVRAKNAQQFAWTVGFVRIGEEMATRTRYGNGALQTAMALLIQNQAQLAGDMAQIRRDFDEIKRYLIRHEELLAISGSLTLLTNMVMA